MPSVKTQVKDQYNNPRDVEGREMPILLPCDYPIEELIKFARKQGFDAFPNPDEPRNFPYWDTWSTGGGCPEVLVSCTGVVAVKFRDAESYKVLQQQWNYQGQEPWSQKYLTVWFASNPSYPTESSPQSLHRLVGVLHSDITTDLIYTDSDGSDVLRPRLQVDHLDKDKSNNSVFNLYLVTAEQNQRMRSWSVAEKRLYYERRVKVDRDLVHINQ